jgi:hypothetical protein
MHARTFNHLYCIGYAGILVEHAGNAQIAKKKNWSTDVRLNIRHPRNRLQSSPTDCRGDLSHATTILKHHLLNITSPKWGGGQRVSLMICSCCLQIIPDSPRQTVSVRLLTANRVGGCVGKVSEWVRERVWWDVVKRVCLYYKTLVFVSQPKKNGSSHMLI